jgi:hypothetical protein
LFNQENRKKGKERGGAFETRSASTFTRSPRRLLPSISEIPFLDSCVPYLNLRESAELFLLFVSSVVKSRGYFGGAAETFTRSACAPQIREIRVIRGCLLFPQLVSIRVDSWLVSQKRRQVAALQSASRAIREIRGIRDLLLFFNWCSIRVDSWLAPKILRNFP